VSISSISPIVTGAITGSTPVKSAQMGNTDSFQNALANAVQELNGVQNQADDAIARLAMGDNVDLHDVTIAVEEANIAFSLALQVRNKLVEAYQEVMRMQV